MAVTSVLIWLLVLTVGCGQRTALSQGQGKHSGLQSDNRITTEGGPAPLYLDMSITPQQQEYKQGDVVNLIIKLKNIGKETLHIANTPTILVGSATISTTNYDRIAIPDLGNITLKPGDTINSSARWKQNGEPGKYQIEFGDINLGYTTMSGGGSRFFVQYPSGTVHMRTIESGETIKLPTEDGDLQFVLKRIEMNEHETKVYFDFITNLEAPMGYQMSLARSNDSAHPEPAAGDEQRQQKNGIIEGTATFNPITRDVTKLQILISDWSVIYKGVRTERLKGPWTIDVQIK